MEFLQIIYLIAAAAVGLFAGMIIELFADAATVRRLETQNECLRLRVEELENGNADAVQVIEINDNRAQPDNYFIPF